jgi:hypothetical protein
MGRKLKYKTEYERLKAKSEIRKSNNPDWLDKWVDKLDEEMDDAHEKAMYAKKSKIKKPKKTGRKRSK